MFAWIFKLTKADWNLEQSTFCVESLITFCEIVPITLKKGSYAVQKVYISILESFLTAHWFEGNAALNLAHFK